MATKTPNLGLTKPDQTDYYDVDVFNSNFNSIDKYLNTAMKGKRLVTGSITLATASQSAVVTISLPYGKPTAAIFNINTGPASFGSVSAMSIPDVTGKYLVSSTGQSNGELYQQPMNITWSDTDVKISNFYTSGGEYLYGVFYLLLYNDANEE